MSELMREALRKRAAGTIAGRPSREFYGFRPIPAGGEVVTNELVNELRDELAVLFVLSLQDVNVLIALLDENHAHHLDASAWFGDHVEEGWA